MMLTDTEKDTAREAVAAAIRAGAGQARVTIIKSVADECMMLDSEIDSITHSADRTMVIEIFADGRYGRFSTNRIDPDGLKDFIPRCVEAAKNMEEDYDRHLPGRDLFETLAINGDEMGVTDPEYPLVEPSMRLEAAKRGCPDTAVHQDKEWKLVSCENSRCDSIEETYICDSDGNSAYKTETAFAVTCELTVESGGKLYEAGARSSSPFISRLKDPQEVTSEAIDRALAKIGSGKIRSARKNMVVDRRVGTKILGPLITALYGDMVYNGDSFLKDRLGEKVFPEMLTLKDLPRSSRGHMGARLFDSEGCSTADRTLIGNGVVRFYLLNTYYAAKLGLARTADSVSVPVISPCRSGSLGTKGEKNSVPGCREVPGEICASVPEVWDRDAIVKAVGNGILVTGFNGGNCNYATGDYSYGVEGFVIRSGRIVRPVGGMLITGNMVELWNSLLAAGNDPKEYGSWAVPTLAFGNVSFSGGL